MQKTRANSGFQRDAALPTDMTATPPEERTERLDLRVPEYVKARIRSAAALMGRSMSDFIVAAALSEAEAVSESVDRWTLDDQDSRFVLELMASARADEMALRDLLQLSESPKQRSSIV